jgi:hypothetical protein
MKCAGRSRGYAELPLKINSNNSPHPTGPTQMNGHEKHQKKQAKQRKRQARQLFLYGQELAPYPQLRVVAGASLSLSLSASV